LKSNDNDIGEPIKMFFSLPSSTCLVCTVLLHFYFLVPILGTKISSISSTCDEDLRNGEWKVKNISRDLKEWIESIKVTEISNLAVSLLRLGTKMQELVDVTAANLTDNPFVLEFHDSEKKTLKQLGNLHKGPFWISGGQGNIDNFANGFFYGNVVINGYVNGSDSAFIYPDLKTALYGFFVNGEMVAAQRSKIVAHRCIGPLKELKVRVKKT
jgi:hypothetical protein